MQIKFHIMLITLLLIIGIGFFIFSFSVSRNLSTKQFEQPQKGEQVTTLSGITNSDSKPQAVIQRKHPTVDEPELQLTEDAQLTEDSQGETSLFNSKNGA